MPCAEEDGASARACGPVKTTGGEGTKRRRLLTPSSPRAEEEPAVLLERFRESNSVEDEVAYTQALLRLEVGEEVQKRRGRTAAALHAVLERNGVAVATARPRDILSVLVRVSGRTGSRDGVLKDIPATQALENVVGDLRHFFDVRRDPGKWVPSTGQGNPARSCEVEAYVAAHGKLLLQHGVTPKSAPAMDESDAQAWMRAAQAVVERETTVAGRIRALRNRAHGGLLLQIGVRSIDVLRVEWPDIVERASAEEGEDPATEATGKVLLLLPDKPERKSAGRGRRTRKQVVLERQSDARYCAVAALEAFGAALQQTGWRLRGPVFTTQWPAEPKLPRQMGSTGAANAFRVIALLTGRPGCKPWPPKSFRSGMAQGRVDDARRGETGAAAEVRQQSLLRAALGRPGSSQHWTSLRGIARYQTTRIEDYFLLPPTTAGGAAGDARGAAC